jgi:hypothetical protein
MSDRRNNTCEARIDEELESRLESLRETFAKVDSDSDQDEGYQELDELPLSVETIRSVRIVLSTGGPHDEFVFTLDSDGEIVRTEYVFQDWFDGARRTVDDETAKRLGDYFAQIVNWGER